ncbi:unnamed protein product [Clavelina lepadiformis]|uniref:Uncharacterized protein n=1 Tax=Clavelina lepadiformis TaxID=159417 RepID=A0ABP0FM34_CLALP
MKKGRAIQVVDDLNLKRVQPATRISSDLEYKRLKSKQQERTPEKYEIPGGSQNDKRKSDQGRR